MATARLRGVRTPPAECTVVVVGAGLAGLQAAATLTRAFTKPGEVVVVEATDRIGGRVKQADGIVPWPVNTGPEFIHGGQNSPLVDLVRRAGWSTTEYEWPDRYYYGKEKRMFGEDAKDIDVERVHKLFEHMDKVKLKEGEDISALEWLRRAGETDKVIALAECIYANDFGTSLRNLGVRELQIEQAAWNQGEEYLVLDRALGCIPRYLAEGVQVFTEWPVGSVAYDQPGRTGVEVRGARGGLIRCAAVVVAVPLSQLQEGLAFDPPLPPAHQSALQAMAMGNAAKISLAFETRFWPADLFDVVCTDCFLPEIWMIRPLGAEDQPGSANHLITAFCAGDRADTLLKMGDSEILARALAQLDAMFGTPATPAPATAAFVQGAVHNWGKEPYVRAAYTYPRVGAAGKREALGAPVRGQLFLAGEHTDPGVNPCMQSAMATGSRAAAQVLAAIALAARRCKL